MKQLILATPLILCACASTDESATFEAMMGTPTEALDEAARERVFGAVAALEGVWEVETPEGTGYIEFEVTSGGSVVRETMFPDTQGEMTNMYSLNGNDLMMTHYCGAGNQPRMLGRELEDGSLAFESFAVSGLASPDALYMGSLTLVFVDEDTIEERWTATEGDTTSEMAFELKRALN